MQCCLYSLHTFYKKIDLLKITFCRLSVSNYESQELVKKSFYINFWRNCCILLRLL